MKFVAAFEELLAEAQLPPQLREAWSFSACMSLVIALARLAPGASPSTSPSLGATVSDAGCEPLHFVPHGASRPMQLRFL